MLMQPQNVGGLGSADAILCLFQLYRLLIGVVADYGLALGAMADLLEPTKVSEIVDLIDQTNERYALYPRNGVLQFVEKGT